MTTQIEIEAGAKAAYEESVFDPQDEAPDWGHLNPLAKLAYIRKIKAALEAAEQVRWQPIETAPKDGTYILAILSWLPYPKVLFWATYANEWRCPVSENKHGPYEPILWQHMPSMPSEDK
jgi:hypothetical protein